MQSRSSEIVLYTPWAQRLITGRKADRSANKHPIYGLLLFAKLNSVIWTDAAQSNPYAIWFLSRFDDKQRAVQDSLDSHIKTAENRWKDSGHAYDESFTGGTGKAYPLLLKTPYSWTASRQIKQLDNYYLQTKQLNGFGLMSDKEFHGAVREINSLILACFNESRQYISVPVTWDNRLPNNEEVRQALATMGDLPSDIANASKRPEYLPKK